MTMTTISDEQGILEIVARLSNRDIHALQPDDSLTDLGIDSLAFIMLILEVEQSLGRPLFDIENVGQLRTVDDLLAPLRQ